jgi:predicted MFS family arabinose efflux permease
MRSQGIRKSALILPISLLSYTALIVTTFSMIFYARDLFQAPASVIGWLAALFHLCYFSGCFLFRPMFRLLLPKHSLILASASSTALLLGMLLVQSLAQLFLLYGLFGFSMSLFWPPLMGWLSIGKEERELNTTLGHFNLSWSGGNMIAPFIAGFLLQRGITVPFVAAASIMTGVCLTVLTASLVFPGIRMDRQRETIPEQRKTLEDRSTPLRYPAWIGLCASYVILGITLSIFPLYLRDEIGLTESRIGLLLLIRGLLSTLGFVVLARQSFWHFKPWLMILGQGLMVVLVAVMIILRSFPGLSLVLALFGLLYALSYSNSLFHGVTGSLHRSTRMAVHEGLLTAGTVTGAAIGGILYQSGPFLRVLLFGCIVVAAGAVAQTTLVLVYRRANPSGGY